MLRLLDEESKKISLLNYDGQKEILEIRILRIQQHLKDVYGYLLEALNVVENILKVRELRTVKNEKDKLYIIIIHIASICEEIKKEAGSLMQTYEQVKKTEDEKTISKIQAIPLRGRLKNG